MGEDNVTFRHRRSGMSRQTPWFGLLKLQFVLFILQGRPTTTAADMEASLEGDSRRKCNQTMRFATRNLWKGLTAEDPERILVFNLLF